MQSSEWLQLGLGGAALFVLVVFSMVLYRVVMRAVEPLQAIARSLDGVRAEIGGVRERVARIEGKLDTHFDWTPVETPRVEPPRGGYSFTRAKSEPGRGR